MHQEELINLIQNNYDEFLAYKKANSDIEISEADISHLHLEGVDLSDIDFSGTSFIEGNLVSVDFSDCDLTSANFSRCNLVECNFSGALLNGTNFNYATLNYCAFDDADMAGANLAEADLTDSDFSASENLDSVRFDDSTVWPDDEKLPPDFDCTYNKDLSSLEDEEDSAPEMY